MEQIIAFLKEFGVFVGVGLVGIALVGYGVMGSGGRSQARVEIIKGEEQVVEDGLENGEREIVVDVAGGVISPGLHKLQSGSRIGDAVVMAGGFAEQADLDWVAQTLNLAEVLKDGGKIYIPILGRETPSQSNGKGVTLGVTSQSTININTASLGELDGLAGIGEVRARAIIDNRPYSKVEELVSKAKIPESVYEKIKDQVSVY